ncbi:hypothetical protein [Azospirillum soli]|uniref:hypothetical protein n=1 Tax=Azospirillum soli TaxID=1304799 RepID=UPI001AE5D050|nr:hypothetical protein [Azospirillum soli]MBP2314774.1 hypothetical protein [Azospirillum soli]
MRVLNSRAVTAMQRAQALTADDVKHFQSVVYWKFVTGALFLSACSLLPGLLQR